jgi:hypothetical protein
MVALAFVTLLLAALASGAPLAHFVIGFCALPASVLTGRPGVGSRGKTTG